MKRFTVSLVETESYRGRKVTVDADFWYVEDSGALVFKTWPPPGTFGGQELVTAFGPRAWEQVK